MGEEGKRLAPPCLLWLGALGSAHQFSVLQCLGHPMASEGPVKMPASLIHLLLPIAISCEM